MEFTDNLKKVVILGIGGKASFYVARFLNLAGIELVGYDLQKSERTEDLEKLGVKINYRNPEKGESFDSDMFLYSNDLPQALQKQVKDDNKDVKAVEIGAFYREIIESFKNGDMSKEEIEALLANSLIFLFIDLISWSIWLIPFSKYSICKIFITPRLISSESVFSML